MYTLKQRLQLRSVLEKQRLVEESYITNRPNAFYNHAKSDITRAYNKVRDNIYVKADKSNEDTVAKNAEFGPFRIPAKDISGNRTKFDASSNSSVDYTISPVRSGIGYGLKLFIKGAGLLSLFTIINSTLNNFLKSYLIVDLPVDKVITQNSLDRFTSSLKMNVFPEFVSRTFQDVDDLSKKVSNTLSHWIPFSETDTNLLNDLKHQLLAFKAQIEIGLTKAKEYGTDDTSLLISKARVDKDLQLVTNELQQNLDKLNGVKVESNTHYGFLITGSMIAIALAYYGIIKYSDTFKLKFLETKINDLFVKHSEKYPELMKLKSEIQNEEVKFMTHYQNDNFIQNKIRLSLSTELMLKKQMILIIGLLYVCYRYLYELKLTYDVKNAESLIKTIKNNDYKIGEKVVFDIVEIYNSWCDMISVYFPDYSKYLKTEVDAKFFKLCIDFTKSNVSAIPKPDNQLQNKQFIKPMMNQPFVKKNDFQKPQNKFNQFEKKG